MDDRGKCEENFSRDEETHDAIFCSKQLIRPRWFSSSPAPCHFLSRVTAGFMLVLFATVQ